MTKSKLLDALNRLDGLASESTNNENTFEAQQQAKDYKLLFDFIEKARTTPKKIKIPFTYSDCEELKDAENGEVFNWNFDGVNTIIIKED